MQYNGWTSPLTSLHTDQGDSVLADEPVPDEIIVLNYKSHQRQFRQVHVELERLIKHWVEAWKRGRT